MNANKVEILLTAARLAAVREALALLTKDGSDKEVGRKCLLLAYLLGCSPCETQRELAAKLGVSESRVSRMCKVLRPHFRPKA